MKHRHLIVLVVITMIALAPTTQAHADMAPPEPPAGGSLDTGEPSTYVQMVSEDVLMTVGDESADVKATFNMLNQGTVTETLNVRFPAGYEWKWSSGETYSDWGLDIDSFVVHVDGKKRNFTVDHQPDELDVWTTWQVTFPPGQLVTVEVSYQGFPGKDKDITFPIYSYILETGAGWYGTIGEGTVTIQLPYKINQYNLLKDSYPPPGNYTVSGTDIIWQFTALEPTSNDNIFVVVMPPPAWREWQAAKKAVEEEPDLVSAHLRLAYALRRTVSYARNNGCFDNCELFDRAEQEYNLWLNVIPNECVSQIIPNIMDYHLDYIDMLKRDPALNDELFCPEIKRVAALAPNDERIASLIKDVDWCTDATLFPTPTLYSPPGCDPLAGRCPPPTLTPTTTPRPTSTPRPTWTPTITPTQTVTPPPTPQPPSPSLTLGTLVGIAAVVIAGAGIGVWAARRKARPGGD